MATKGVNSYSYPVTSKTSRSTDFATLLEDYTKQYETAKASNIERYEQSLAIFDEIINRYRPGGSFGQAALAELASQKEQYIGRGTQDLISSGLFGTSVRAGLGGRFEKEIGSPYRLKLEDLMMERLSTAQMGKAGLIESREDVYPDINQMIDLAEKASQGKGTSYPIIAPTQSYFSQNLLENAPQTQLPGAGTARYQPVSRPSGTSADYMDFYRSQLEAVQSPQTTYSEEELSGKASTQTPTASGAGAATTGSSGRYAPQSAAEAVWATKRGYYSTTGKQLKPYTPAQTEEFNRSRA